MKKLAQLYYINSFNLGHKCIFNCDSLTILQMSLRVTSAEFQANLTDRKGFSKLRAYCLSGQQAAQTEQQAHVHLAAVETKASHCPLQRMCRGRKRKRQSRGEGRKRATAEKYFCFF